MVTILVHLQISRKIAHFLNSLITLRSQKVNSYELTFCGLIAERFVFKEMCSDRGYALPLEGELRSWELIMCCVLNEKNIKNQGTCRSNFNLRECLCKSGPVDFA